MHLILQEIVQILKKVGEWCRQAGALFIVDASQTAGHFPINIEENHIDVLCFTGHKGLMGPQGTGGLCVRKGSCCKTFIIRRKWYPYL